MIFSLESLSEILVISGKGIKTRHFQDYGGEKRFHYIFLGEVIRCNSWGRPEGMKCD